MDRLAQSQIDAFIAEHGITEAPIGRHGPRPRCGDQPRKEGERYTNGRLKWRAAPPDTGHQMTMLHREELVGIADAHDPRASYVIGQLDLAGKLVDRGQDRDSEHGAEQSKRRHNAAVRFAKVHFWLFGPHTTPSHMKNLLTGFTLPSPDASDDDRAELAGQFGLWVTRAKSVGGYPVLERAAIYDVAPSGSREEAILRLALDAITGDHKRDRMHHAIHGDLMAEPPQAANDNLPPARHRPRRGLPVMFGTADRPDPAKLADAISRFKAGTLSLPTGSGRTFANDNEAAADALVA